MAETYDKPDQKLAKLTDAEYKVKVCRDFYDGYPKVMNTTYIQKWGRESDTAYVNRIANTAFPNMFAPIVTGLTGLITKKEAVVNGLESFDLDNVDNKGTSLSVFIKDVCESSIIAGIEFVSVERKNKKSESYFKRYPYESLMSYQLDGVKVTQMVFKEIFEANDGAFLLKEVERYTVFKIGGGEIWYDSDDGNGLRIQDDWTNTLDELPVVSFISGKELSRFEILPRMYDIAKLNQVALNHKSQLANVLSVVGNPVLMLFGTLLEESKNEDGSSGITIGVNEALRFDDKKTDGGEYLEVTGDGVVLLQKEIESIEGDVDRMSAGLLEKSSSNTIIDAQEDQNKSTSFLTDVAVELENKFNKLYDIKGKMRGKEITENDFLEFKKDFDLGYTEEQLKLLFEMVKTGDLSRETLWRKLQEGNILKKDFDASLEREMIEQDASVL